MADPNDPFAAMGGGVKTANGGWIPKGMATPEQLSYVDPTRDATGRETLAKSGTTAAAPSYEDTTNAWLQGEAALRQQPAAAPAPTSPDPFASIGGGVYANGGWTPAGMAQPAAPTNSYATPAPAAAPASDDPFASMGGGVRTANGGWVPVGHPDAGGAQAGGTAPAAGGAAGGGAYIPPNAAPGTPGSSPLDTQTSNAQTYSQTPGAAPLDNTTNQGTQDVVRNTYLQQIQKGTAVDTNDPNFRMQSDAFAAAQERARRNQLDDVAQESFQSGQRGSGADNVERRMMDEKAAQNVGSFEAELVGKELTNRRDEIKNALSELGGLISNDQKNDLNRELAALDAAIKREGIGSTERIAGQDFALRDKLGTGALNVDMLRALLQNEQFGVDSGIRIGDLEAKYSGLF